MVRPLCLVFVLCSHTPSASLVPLSEGQFCVVKLLLYYYGFCKRFTKK